MKYPLKTALIVMFLAGVSLALSIVCFVMGHNQEGSFIGIVGIIHIAIAISQYRIFVRKFDRVLDVPSDGWK